MKKSDIIGSIIMGALPIFVGIMFMIQPLSLKLGSIMLGACLIATGVAIISAALSSIKHPKNDMDTDADTE